MEKEENIEPFPSLPTVLGNHKYVISHIPTARRLRAVRRTYTDIPNGLATLSFLTSYNKGDYSERSDTNDSP